MTLEEYNKKYTPIKPGSLIPRVVLSADKKTIIDRTMVTIESSLAEPRMENVMFLPQQCVAPTV